MADYPLDRASRVQRRAAIRGRTLARAEVEAARAGRSIVCGEYDRHDSCAGARYCLCECHDPSEAGTGD